MKIVLAIVLAVWLVPVTGAQTTPAPDKPAVVPAPAVQPAPFPAPAHQPAAPLTPETGAGPFRPFLPPVAKPPAAAPAQPAPAQPAAAAPGAQAQTAAAAPAQFVNLSTPTVINAPSAPDSGTFRPFHAPDPGGAAPKVLPIKPLTVAELKKKQKSEMAELKSSFRKAVNTKKAEQRVEMKALLDADSAEKR